MKILFCNYEYPPLGGGGGIVNAWLAECLASDHKVTVLTSSAKGLPLQEELNGVRIVRVPVYFRKEQQAANLPSLGAFVINGMRRGVSLLREESFDVINTHFVIPTGPVGDYLAKRAHIPNVLSVHGGDLYDPSKFLSPHKHWPLRAVARHFLRRADSIVGQSSNTNANVAQFYDAALDCELIPLGIPRVEFPQAERSRYGFDGDDFLMITIGRLVERKGVGQLIEILNQIDNPKAKIIVVGGGPKMQEWQRRAQELQLSKRIYFAGQASEEEKNHLLACADAYVSTSQHEGFGLVFLEGMAAGLPVVCYDNGGQTDFVIDDSNGFLVKLNDTAQFKARLEQLSADPALRERLSEESQRTVENYFIDTCARRYVELFERHLAEYGATS